jgi:hypothetical protein
VIEHHDVVVRRLYHQANLNILDSQFPIINITPSITELITTWNQTELTTIYGLIYLVLLGLVAKLVKPSITEEPPLEHSSPSSYYSELIWIYFALVRC